MVARSLEVPIPTEAKSQVFQDLLHLVNKECQGDSAKPEAFYNRLERSPAGHHVDVALCYFTGFGCNQDHKKGLEFMRTAAEYGNIPARAVLGRLYQACGEHIPASDQTVEWLMEGTAAGSRIASTELYFLDPVRHTKAIGKFRDWWSGFGAPRPINQDVVADLKAYFKIHDEYQFVAAIKTYMAIRHPSIHCVDDVEYKRWNLLHFAATFGHTTMAKQLLEMGASINRPNLFGDTALLCACRSGRSSTALFLLEKGASAAIPDALGVTALHYMIYLDRDDIENVAAKLVGNGVDVHAKSWPVGTSSWGRLAFMGEPRCYSDTALHWAVAAGRIDVAEVLLSLGADPLEPGLKGFEGLLSDLSIAQFKPGPSIKDEYTSALAEAAYIAHLPMVDLFLQHISRHGKRFQMGQGYVRGVTRRAFDLMLGFLFYLTYTNELRSFRCMHGSHYKDNVIGVKSRVLPVPTPGEDIWDAISCDCHFLIQHMLDLGFNINGLTPPGLTPIQLACMKQSGSIVLFLLEKGADPRSLNSQFKTSCITLLSMSPFPSLLRDVVSALHNAGITYETNPAAFKLLFRRTVKEGWYDVAREILARGANREDLVSQPPLLEEILSQNSDASLGPLMFLLEPQHDHGQASPILRANWTVFHQLASVSEDIRDDALNSRIARYLISIFPRPSILNKRFLPGGSTAIAIATDKGNYRLVSQLLEAGSDPEEGRITAVDFIVSRIISPEIFTGGLAGLSRRQHYQARHESNSLRTLRVLLVFHVASQTSLGIERQEVLLARLIKQWQSAIFQDEVVNGALRELLKEDVVLYETNGRIYIKNRVTLELRLATLPEIKLCMTLSIGTHL